MMAKLCWPLVLVVLIGTACSLTQQSRPLLAVDKQADEAKSVSSNAEQRLWRYLGCLPRKTETIVVAQGPFRIPAESPKRELPTFQETLESFSLGGLPVIRDEKYRTTLASQTVLLSVEGAGHFRSPKSLGLCPYDGCHIVVFDDTFSRVSDELIQTLKADADHVHKENDRELLEFAETWESDRWQIFVARPLPNVLLCGTDPTYVAATYAAVQASQQQSLVAFKAPAHLRELPEWPQVNTKARYWAIRHFDATHAKTDPTTPLTTESRAANFPDQQAVGMTFSFEPESNSLAVVDYLSSNPKAAETQKRLWSNRELRLKPAYDTSKPNLVRATMRLEGPSNVASFWLGLFAMLGHAVYF